MVGIFWMLGGALVAAGCILEEAEQAGDWIDYPGGHADYWERWQMAGSSWLTKNGLPLEILTTEYDDHPRGRIVFDQRANCFLLYADRRLQTSVTLDMIKQTFFLADYDTKVLSDLHYR